MRTYVNMLANSRSIAANFLHLGMIQVSNAVIQLLLFPLIIRKTGMEAFGNVVVANAFAALAGLLINFGTSISGVQSVAAARANSGLLAQVYHHTLQLRCCLAVVVLSLLPLVKWISPQHFTYFLLAMPLALAELVSPLFFFNGVEKLLLFNIGNLVGKLLSVLLILLLIQGPADAGWVNFYLGLPALFVFGALNLFLVRRYRLQWVRPRFTPLAALGRKNLPLAGNNLAVQLQQSFFLFVLSGAATSMWLGAYAIADKVLWGFRLVLIAFSNALFPKAVQLAVQDPGLARQVKGKINSILAVMFGGVALVLYCFPEGVVRVFAGAELPLASGLIRAIAPVPLLAALNLLNVVELLVQHRYNHIFRIALLLTFITITASLLLVYLAGPAHSKWYPLVAEAAALGLYLFFLNRKKTHEPNQV